MRLRPDRGRAIPASEPSRLHRSVRRTTIARAALAAALVVLFGATVLVARQYDVRHAPLVASGTSGVIVLDLSASVFEGGFECDRTEAGAHGRASRARRLLGYSL